VGDNYVIWALALFFSPGKEEGKDTYDGMKDDIDHMIRPRAVPAEVVVDAVGDCGERAVALMAPT